MSELTLSALENWLWEAACVVRQVLTGSEVEMLPLGEAIILLREADGGSTRS